MVEPAKLRLHDDIGPSWRIRRGASSPTEFDEASGWPAVLPITSGGAFARSIGFAIPVTDIKTSGVVRCDQPRVLDLNARNGRKVDIPPQSVLDEVPAGTVTPLE